MQSNLTAVQTCPVCGCQAASFYFSGGICDDCKWDTWIPRGYKRREKYVYSEIWKHYNATRRPELGIDFLDARAKITPNWQCN